MNDRLCRNCDDPLVRGENEPNRDWARRRYCNKGCKTAKAELLRMERRDIAQEMPTIALVPDFVPHEITLRAPRYMTRIDRALPEQSLSSCSAAWAVATGGE